MKLFGRLRNGITEDRRRAVIEAPATFNRAARREAGVYGRAWAWDPQVLGAQGLVARYVRRNYSQDILTAPKTRRQRKVRARILRSMASTAR